MRPPAFQFYPDDFLAGTFDLSPHEVGVVIRLLCHQWNRAFLPNDMEKLQRLAGGNVSDDVLSKFPVAQDGTRKNVRLENERAKQLAYREKQSNFGKTGGRPPKGSKKGTLSKPLSEPLGVPLQLPFADPKGNPFENEKGLESSPSVSPFVSPSVSPSPSPNPRAEESAQKEEVREEPKDRPRNLVWDAICELFALEPSQMTKAEQGKIGRVVKELKAATPDVTRDDIRRRAAEYRKRFPGAAFTPTALMSHWSTLAQPVTPPARNDSWKVVDIRDCL